MDDYVYDDKISEEIAQRIRGMSDEEFEIYCCEELMIDFRGGRTPIPEQFIEEEKKIIRLLLSLEEDLSIEEIVENYASDTYKQYLNARKKRQERLWKQGILEN